VPPVRPERPRTMERPRCFCSSRMRCREQILSVEDQPGELLQLRGFFCVSRLLVSFQRSVAREPLVTLFTQLI
jgi:hypothetical protein